MDYISTIEAGEKWNLSHRRVAILCSEGRIPGVKKVGNTCLFLSFIQFAQLIVPYPLDSYGAKWLAFNMK